MGTERSFGWEWILDFCSEFEMCLGLFSVVRVAGLSRAVLMQVPIYEPSHVPRTFVYLGVLTRWLNVCSYAFSVRRASAMVTDFEMRSRSAMGNNNDPIISWRWEHGRWILGQHVTAFANYLKLP